MNPTFLTENGWKTICRDAKIKDTRLLQALAAYEGAGKDDLEGQLKELGTIGQVADGLKKNREVASNAEAAKYLVEVVNAAKSQRQAVLKAKEAADKAAAATRKQAEAQAKQAGHDEAEQEGVTLRNFWPLCRNSKARKISPSSLLFATPNRSAV